MVKRGVVRMLKRVGTALGLMVLLALGRASHGQTVTAVPTLDLTKFTGNWYEIARLPTKRDKNCDHDSVVLIALGDKKDSLQLVIACQTKKGFTQVRNVNGKPEDKTSNGKLKVTTFWPFSEKYWVLAIDPNYDWALVGNPNHKELWVLGRTGAMDAGVLAGIEAKAAAEGFNTTKLISTPQTKRYQIY